MLIKFPAIREFYVGGEMTVFPKIVFGVLSMSVAVWAQTAEINGTVRDATGAAIPGASVKATQTATGVVRTTASGADGGYVLPNLPVGPYLLEVAKEGFSKYVQTGIVLQVDTTPTIDVSMRVGGVNEQVTVNADAPLRREETASLGALVSQPNVTQLPLNGRTYVTLVQIAPPTRSDVTTYQDIRQQLEYEAGRINGKYSGLDYTPIR